MNKLGWFLVGVLVALSISTIADEGSTPDESRLRQLAFAAEKSVKFENKLQDLERESAELLYRIKYRQMRGIFYEL